MNIYLNEFNISMGNTIYLPYVSGFLKTYCQGIDGYKFMPFVFRREKQKYINPYIMAFSVSMWNEQYSLSIAKNFKKSIVIFGGTQVTDDYLKRHSFIDVVIRDYGEQAFYDVLQRLRESRNLEGIPNVIWRDKERIVFNHRQPINVDSLDIYPSPYIAGAFDYLMDKGNEYQAIIETNRGCPSRCTYCTWGNKEDKMYYHSVDYVKKDMDWCGKNKIKYVYNADANFGIAKRDEEIADAIIETKVKYGYPEKLRTCFFKASNQRVSRIINKFVSNGIDKGATLSFQSLDEKVNHNVKRLNIELDEYRNLLVKFNNKKIPVYTELIIGLPGETIYSFIRGIDKIIQAGLTGQLFIFWCEIYPNSMLDDKNYQKTFGIVTRRMLITSTHSVPLKIKEYQDIVVSTASMSLDDWKFMLKFSWIMQLLFSMKIGVFIMRYLKKELEISYTTFAEYVLKSNIIEGLDEKVNDMLSGKSGRCVILKEFGDIYWEVEEAEFLKIANNPEPFYNKLSVVIFNMLDEFSLNYDDNAIIEIIRLQISKIPKIQDKKEFAKRVVLWGRKSNKILEEQR